MGSFAHMVTTRRKFLASSSALGLASLAGTAPAAPSAKRFPRRQRAIVSRAPLAPQAFYLLPAGTVRAAGWLRQQLEIQAAGLSGHLDDALPEHLGATNGWRGGEGNSWEDAPYWLDGLLPLAWQLDSDVLKAKAQRFIDWTLANVSSEGMIGPKLKAGNSTDDLWWPRMVMLKVLMQYYELTGDPRVLPAMTGYFRYQLKMLPENPLASWGKHRWQDELVSIAWLYNRTGDSELLQLANLIHSQGYDWEGMFRDFNVRSKVNLADLETMGYDEFTFSVHGVNVAMSLKAAPVWSLFSGEKDSHRTLRHQLAMLDEYHGLPNAMFSATEHLAGRNPSEGVELCAVVEAMYSLEQALAITGDAAFGDRLERIAFNALPAAISDDMWSHQYLQQPNQVECSMHNRHWTTNGPEANTFGLEPNYRCCAMNFSQGWPKLAASLWMASADHGLAVTAYAPCEIATQVRGIDVDLATVTDYPFENRIVIKVDPAAPNLFPIHLRIPGWTSRATVRVNGHELGGAAAGEYLKIDRQWKRGDRIELAFEAPIEMVRGYRGAVSFQRGPIIFALPIDEAWVKWRERGPTADWQVYPASPWNYALSTGTIKPDPQRPPGPVPFSKRFPAASLTVSGHMLPKWLTHMYPVLGTPPKGPIKGDEAGPAQTLTLIPYAASKLRITAFPTMAPQ